MTRIIICTKLLFLVHMGNLVAQDVKFNIPSYISVCEEVPLSIEIKNTSPSLLKSNEISVNLPCGFTYIPGTVSGGATEKNISVSNTPIFVFGDLEAGKVVKIKIIAKIGCAALDCIDQNVLFDIRTNHIFTGSSNTVVSPPFNIQSPGIVITKYESPFIQQINQDKIERKIFIKNARPGRVSHFFLTNTHKTNIAIRINAGTIMEEKIDETKIKLDSSDFKKIGNNDGYFDFNESITIIEEVDVTGCAYDDLFATTEIVVSWGCGTTKCQTNNAKATIKLTPYIEPGPKIGFKAISSEPGCYLPGNALQILELRKVPHSKPLLNLVIDIEQKVGNRGILINSLTSPDNSKIEYLSKYKNQCGDSLAKTVRITFSRLEPNNVIQVSSIRWQTSFCETIECEAPQNTWKYKYSYDKECAGPEDSKFSGSGSIGDPTQFVLSSAMLLFNEGRPVETNDTVMITYFIQSPKLTVSQGDLNVKIQIPISLTPLNPDYKLGTSVPTDVKTNVVGDNNEICLQYKLPLSESKLQINFFAVADCNKVEVDPNAPCVPKFFSSCDNKCFADTTLKTLSISSLTSVDFAGTNCIEQGKLKNCFTSSYSSGCLASPICYDTLPGYIDYNLSVFRTNLGFPDTNEDGYMDDNDVFDPSKLSLTSFIPGDTMKFIIDGVVKVDKPGATFKDVTLILSHEGFKSDSDSEFMKKMLILDKGIKQITSKLKIYDASKSKWYEVDNITDIQGEFISYYRFTTDSLRKKNPSIPLDFKYSEGDSILFEMTKVVDLEAYRKKRTELKYLQNLTFDYNAKMVLEDKPFDPNTYLNLCNCLQTEVKIAGFNLEFSKVSSFIYKDSLICPGVQFSSFLPNLSFGYSTEGNGELRPILKPRGIKLSKLHGFDFGAITFAFRNQKIEFQPTVTAEGYVYNFEDKLPYNGKYKSGNDPFYKIKLQRIIETCLPKVPNDPLKVTIYLEKSEMGDLFYPDSLVATIMNRYETPRLKLELSQKEITAFSNKLSGSFQLKDSLKLEGDIKNVFVKVKYDQNKIKDFRLFDPITGKDYTHINDIYDIGRLIKKTSKTVQFIATSTSCGEEKITFEYGYDCSVYQNPAVSPCYLSKDSLKVKFPGSVVDLLPKNMGNEVQLCTEQEHNVYFFNAGLGTAYDMQVEIKLPAGMTLVPNKTRIYFPAGGSQSFTIPQPTSLGNGTYKWLLSDFWNLHKIQGLYGTTAAPENGFDLRYFTNTDCDFVSGASIIYTTNANQVCDIPTNELAKVTQPVRIEGVTEPYSLNIKSHLSYGGGCTKDSLKLNFNFPNLYKNGAFVKADLPAGWILVPSLTNGNLKNNVPSISNGVLTWLVDSTADTIKMEFWIKNTSESKCQSGAIPIYAVAETKTLCAATMTECDIKIITGKSNVNFNINKPTYEIQQFGAQVLSNNPVRLSATISNNTGSTGNPATANIYWDKNGDGMVSPLDSLVGNMVFTDFDSSDNQSTGITLIDLKTEILCQLILKIDNDLSCACLSSESLLNLPVEIIQNKISLCTGAIANIGLNPVPNTTYQWDSELGLDCTQCALANFSLANSSQNIQNYVKFLTITSGSNCKQVLRYDIDVLPMPSLLTGDAEICLGDTLLAITTDAAFVEWSGMNIINNSGQILVANPNENTRYTVHILDKNGCAGTSSFDVMVHDLPVLNVSFDSIYCFGPRPKLLLQLDTSLSFTWLNAGNRLSDLNSLEPEILTQNDYVFKLEVKNEFCREVLDIPINFEEVYKITGVADSHDVCLGEQLIIDLDSTLSYAIVPAEYVTCQNSQCSSFAINADFSSQIFKITSTDQNGCLATKLFNVKTSQGIVTNEASYTLCSGDSILINGKYVFNSGKYCDTITVGNSNCYKINCSVVTILAPISTTQNVFICPEESYFFNGQILKNEGTYCFPYTSVNGCDSVFCLQLNFHKSEFEINIPLEYVIRAGEEVVLEGPPGYQSYLWTPSEALSCNTCVSPVAHPTADTEYILEVTNEKGCKSSKRIKVKVTPACTGSVKEIPNGFTPNNDGINDFYTLGDILLCGPMKFTVFNRWGNIVYQQENWDNQWDGLSKNGGELPQGTYYVSIEFVSESVIKVGFVDLRRK